MWLIGIQVIALIADISSGWGVKPVIMYGLQLAFSFVEGAVVGLNAIICPFCQREVNDDFYIKQGIDNEELDRLQNTTINFA